MVSSENSPMSSLIIGVDLVSIRPVHNCITLQEDITTEKCRQRLRQELKTWKADGFLHDGAPNLGKNWLHDAFQQVELTLHALRLATDFLKKGGWFVSKVFRSKDYFSLLWVFQQLFRNVHATKPKASRNESAEIFVVCQGFTAPDKIDPKFLDPKFVFKEIDQDEPVKLGIDLIHPEKKRRHREGYPEGDYTLFHTLHVSKFMESDNFIELLANASEIVLDDAKVAEHRATTQEIKECLKDIKVLGKKEIRNIFSWRKKIQKDLYTEEENSLEKEVEEEEESSDGEAELREKLAKMEEEERRRLKRKLRKTRKEKSKLRHKMDLKLVLPDDKHDFVDDLALFNLSRIKSKKDLENIEAGDQSVLDSDLATQQEELDSYIPLNLNNPKMRFARDSKNYLDPDDVSEEEFESDPEFEEESDHEHASHGNDEETDKNPLMVDLETSDARTQRKLNAWFSKDVFADLDEDENEDLEIEKMAADYKKRGGTILGREMSEEKPVNKTTSKLTKPKKVKENYDSGNASLSEHSDADDSSSSSSDSDNSDYDERHILQSSKKRKLKLLRNKTNAKDGFEIVPPEEPVGRLDEVGLAIGEAMIESRKRKRDIIDGAYNRNMFDDDGLPAWFITDETRHRRLQLPVTKEAVQEYKLKQRSIDARPIKKVAEAKARKHKRQLNRINKARKKAESVTDAVDVSEKEKWQQIKQIYKKAGLLKEKKKEVTYVVAKRGIGRRVHRPAGVSGQFKVVDGRMKKDTRAKMRKVDKQKGNKGKKKGPKISKGKKKR
ncbi:pre-rRNA 2'-O-ribose RNA methyltransferase FTSJ3-like isoform X2 [Gigantopelta aegis]|uniref:pre-rRNA 2'-O-ribose RNA methyltransferase FTSJ3-like isoform X2 n=1 Tax=Gigantopelta aegis TaxID=1735272 RepID=UPI001B88DF98|nr:pre-rRNA 2'-O-ribose RNA methyltransferase FTSJ3-like isoform X2 [Gigantopelta aegis]